MMASIFGLDAQLETHISILHPPPCRTAQLRSTHTTQYNTIDINANASNRQANSARRHRQDLRRAHTHREPAVDL